MIIDKIDEFDSTQLDEYSHEDLSILAKIIKRKAKEKKRLSHICNMCGLSCTLAEVWQEFGGIAGVVVSGGYNSTPGNGSGALDDTQSYKFNLCEWCLDWLFSQFAIPIASTDYMTSGIAPEYYRPAYVRVTDDEWRRQKDSFFEEWHKRSAAREPHIQKYKDTIDKYKEILKMNEALK